MSLPPETIEVGQCYLTVSGSVRRVRAILQGRVQFENRVKVPNGCPWGWRTSMLDIKSFAFSEERPVPYDWTPEPKGEPNARCLSQADGACGDGSFRDPR